MNGIWTAILVVVAIWVLGLGSSSETRTIYIMECDKPVKLGQCEGNAYAFSKNRVRAFPESQRVIASLSEGAWSLGKCVVFDGDNWYCEYEDGSGTTTMTDGKYHQTPKDKVKRDYLQSRFQVSAVRYWYAVLRAMF